MNDLKVIKLSSGEDIITKLEITDGDFLRAEDPLKVNLYSEDSDNYESLGLSRWMAFSEDNTCVINKSNIISMCDASEHVQKFYKYCMKTLIIKKALEPTDEELKRIDEEIMDEYLEPSKKIH